MRGPEVPLREEDGPGAGAREEEPAEVGCCVEGVNCAGEDGVMFSAGHR